jgi:hypothetical protein
MELFNIMVINLIIVRRFWNWSICCPFLFINCNSIPLYFLIIIPIYSIITKIWIIWCHACFYFLMILINLSIYLVIINNCISTVTNSISFNLIIFVGWNNLLWWWIFVFFIIRFINIIIVKSLNIIVATIIFIIAIWCILYSIII